MAPFGDTHEREMMTQHPSTHFERLEAWAVTDRGLAELVKNQDLVETSPRPSIVGCLLKALADAGLLREARTTR